MEYEKKYKDALERAEIAHKDTDKHIKATIERIFPELRESEDERLRKAIIELLKEVEEDETYTGRQHIPDMLTYLEKQKEQKPASFSCGHENDTEWSEEDEKKIGRLRSVVNQLASYTDSLDVNGDYCEGDYAELDAWLKALLSNLKKKNEDVAKLCSNEWSEEDENFFKTALWHISYSISNGKKTDVHCDTTDWLKGVKERLKALRPQPKQEWSKEDKNMWTHLNGYLNGFSCSEDAIKQMADWFYELPDRFNLQPKQEWSKEGEKTINELCDIIVSNAKHGYLGGYYAPDLVEKLKSIRPQPKQEWSKEDENKMKGSSEIPNDIEDAAEDFGKRQGLELRPFANKFFIAGAKWDREQMMKEAVEGEIAKDNRGNNVLRVGLLNNGFEIGDKIRVIIINQDEK